MLVHIVELSQHSKVARQRRRRRGRHAVAPEARVRAVKRLQLLDPLFVRWPQQAS
jgi:hypothetical protein